MPHSFSRHLRIRRTHDRFSILADYARVLRENGLTRLRVEEGAQVVELECAPTAPLAAPSLPVAPVAPAAPAGVPAAPAPAPAAPVVQEELVAPEGTLRS